MVVFIRGDYEFSRHKRTLTSPRAAVAPRISPLVTRLDVDGPLVLHVERLARPALAQRADRTADRRGQRGRRPWAKQQGERQQRERESSARRHFALSHPSTAST